MTDEQIRAAVLKAWKKVNPTLKPCCGGRGLVVGCPVCGKRLR